MEVKQNRWKSKVLWASLIAQFIAIGQLTGVWAALGLDPGQVGEIAATILAILVTIGILNNPTDKEHW